MISLSLKTKIILISVSAVSIFILGRATAPKPKPEIKMIDNSKSVEQAIENTKKQMLEEQHKEIVRETHTTTKSEPSKKGEIKTHVTDVKESITYNKNSSQNIDSNTQTKSKASDRQSIELKQRDEGIDYTFMIGRSWNDPKYDYIASIGVPIVAGIKLDGGYEFNDKKIFVGATFNF